MKIIFAGSPEFAVPALNALFDRAEVVAVITQPDKAVGRKKALTPTPVKVRALELGIEVFDFPRLREHVEEIKSIGAEAMVTCAYGQLLSQEILNVFPRGVWNLHASLLPKFRGASPIQSAILAGETHTGVTVMKTELAMDSGAILLVKRCEIGEADCGELSYKLSLLAAEAAIETVELLEEGQEQLLLQDEAKVSFCKKIEKEQAKINFNNSPQDICRLIRAMNPQPVAFCYQNGQIINVLRATCASGAGPAGEVIAADKNGISVACAGGAVRIEDIIPAGGKKMRAADYVNGRKIKVGDRLD